MLRRLHINNIALIDELELELADGFNVLSGETGAGKSIIIDSVNFVLGERASRELIKTGAQRAKAEALFDISDSQNVAALLDAQGIECDDNELILSREITSSGKNTCRINGNLVPVSVLKQVSDMLVDIHGQQEHQSLLAPENHTGFLDRSAHKKTEPLLGQLKDICAEHFALMREKNAGFGSEAERQREADMLSFQIQEIEAASLRPCEDNELNAERLILQNAERIKSALDAAHAALSGEENDSTLTMLDAARRQMRDISSFSKDYEALYSRLEEAYYSVEDIAYSVRDANDSLEFDEGRLDEIEERLQSIAALKRKYGGSIEEILKYAESSAKRLESLTRADEYIAELDAKLDAVTKKYAALDAELSKIRKKAADELRGRVLANMADLGLDKSDFCASFTSEAGEIKPEGTLTCEFLLTTNPGEPLKPLAKVASGGELSRIMLCFKAIFADNDSMGTLIFDEIDTGISGKVAAMVGEKMLGIASAHQVICVTHLPQIAALADRHFMVEKHTDGETTSVEVSELDEDGKYRRIAQMMDGDADSSYGYEHARMLIERAQKLKAKN